MITKTITLYFTEWYLQTIIVASLVTVVAYAVAVALGLRDKPNDVVELFLYMVASLIIGSGFALILPLACVAACALVPMAILFIATYFIATKLTKQ